jgi:MFS family permease
MSNGLWEFTAARILQGIGGALMVPVGRLVVLRTTEKKDLVRSIAYITWPGLAAPVIGPPVGGFITTYSSWRWIFYLNVPLGIIGIVLALVWIKNAPGHGRRFDWLGFALAGSACTSIMYSLELLGQQNVRWATAEWFLGYGVIAGLSGVWHMRRTAHPLIRFDTLRQRTFAVVIWGGSLFRLAISVSPFLLPLMFQIAFGLSAFQSGLLVLAMFAGNLFMKPATTPILRGFGFRRVLVVNGLVTAALIGSFSLLSPNTPTALMIVMLFAHGLSRSMQFTAISTLAFVDVPQSQMSSANSFFTVMTQMSMGMGVAVGALTLRLAAWLRGGPSSAPTIADFHLAFGMVSIIAALAVVDCLSLDRNAGAEVSGHAR